MTFLTMAALPGVPGPPVERRQLVAVRSEAQPVIVQGANTEEEEEEDDFDDADIADIYIRSKFLESWLWTDIRLPDVPKPGRANGYEFCFRFVIHRRGMLRTNILNIDRIVSLGVDFGVSV